MGQDFRALSVTGGSAAVIVSGENFRKISGHLYFSLIMEID